MKIPEKTVGRGNKRLDPEAIRRLLDKGMTQKSVGEIFGVTRARIWQLAGPTGAPRGRRPVETNKIKAVLPEIKRLLRGGMYLSEACQKLNIPYGMAKKVIPVIGLRPLLRDKCGNIQSYQRRGCRCKKCCKANTDRCRATQEKRRGKTK